MGTLVANNSSIAPIFALREKKRNEVISLLRDDVQRLRVNDPDLRFWLIGSYAVGNWDSYSDIDVVCVSAKQHFEADFKISDQYPMDVFLLNDSEFQRRINGDTLFKESVEKGLSL
jgi:predicted nucleotidyltransferase